MKNSVPVDLELLCPSAQPGMAGSVVFGVVNGTEKKPIVNYLSDPQPVNDQILGMASPANPTEVLRFSAPCNKNSCQHFNNSNCTLVNRVVNSFPAVVSELPPCKIRKNCRWWQQRGALACLRCPQVVTETHQPTETQRQVAEPPHK